MISLYILRKHIVTKTAGSKTINKDPFNNSLEFHFKTDGFKEAANPWVSFLVMFTAHYISRRSVGSARPVDEVFLQKSPFKALLNCRNLMA